MQLHKLVSNSKRVIESIPFNVKASSIKNLDLLNDNLPVEEALGVEWCIESDSFQLRVNQVELIDVFWSDSKVVLGYIHNDSRRFHIFVANRVQQIRESTNPNQWH